MPAGSSGEVGSPDRTVSPPKSNLFVDRRGRPRWGWRVVLFWALFLVYLFGFFALGSALGLPVDSNDPAGWWGLAFIVPAALAATWSASGWLDRRSVAAVGLTLGRRGGRGLLRGTVLGVALTGSVTLGLAALGWIGWALASGTGPEYALAAIRMAGILVLAAFAEELLFRGYPLPAVADGLGGAAAIGITGVAFGLLHGANPGVGPLALVNITLAGVLLGIAYWRTLDLWFATGVHFGWNWAMALADLSVSGLEMGMPAIDPVLRGPGLWTGGGFGPEAGLAVTVVTTLGILWLWRTKRLSRDLEALALRVPEMPGGGRS